MPKLFISYSREDKKWLDELKISLKPLSITENDLTLWDDTQIRPGQQWNKEIENALYSANAGVFIVTRHFLASDFINRVELPILLQRAEEDGIYILWIAIGPSSWSKSPLVAYQCVNDPKFPVGILSPSEQEQELVNIAERIISVVNAERMIVSNNVQSFNETEKQGGTPYWEKIYSAFWLQKDLEYAFLAVEGSDPIQAQEKLRNAYNHASKIGLKDSQSARRLLLLEARVKEIHPTNWPTEIDYLQRNISWCRDEFNDILKQKANSLE